MFEIILVILALAGLCGVLMLKGWLHLIIVVVLGGVLLIISKVILPKRMKTDKDMANAIRKAREKDDAAERKYRVEVAAELARKEKIYREQCQKANMTAHMLEEKKKTHIAALANLPGLAQQDKHADAVNCMISYIERGKADSIKEALILYDQECARRGQTQVLDRLYVEQLLALEKIQTNQAEHYRTVEDHNRAMRDLERERQKKLDDAIWDIQHNK